MRGKSVYFHISVYYSLVFMALGAFTSYIGLYYDSIHLNHFQIGYMTTVGSLTALFLQPVWGLRADRSSSKNRILLICLLMASASVWLMPISGKNLWLLLVCTIMFNAFQCAINPLGDTIALELAGQNHFPFSRVRTAGSLGYAVMSALAGWILERDIDYLFPAFSIMMFAAFLFAVRIPTVEGHQRKSKVLISEFFRNKPLMLLYLYTFAVESTLGFFFTFHAVYSKEQGISTSLIGIGVMIGSFSQFPFMLYFDRLYKRFGPYKILLFSGIVHAIRWILCAVAMNPVTLIIVWALHGGTFILFYLCLAEYVNQHVQKELKATGQMLNALMTGTISRIFGALAGGALAAICSIGTVFAFCALICSIAVIVLALQLKRHQTEQQSEQLKSSLEG